MNTPSPKEALIVDGRTYQLSQLTEFGFDSPIKLPSSQRRGEGVLLVEDQRVPVEFRVRRYAKGMSSCTFTGLSIADTERIRRHLKRRNRSVGGLEDRSYDELARGSIDSESKPHANAAVRSEKDPQQKSYVKSFAVMAMLLSMLALLVLAVVFLRSRSTLSIANGALVGNSIQVNSKIEGEIVEVLVESGERVSKGDLLVRLTNPEVLAENRELSAQLETAKRKVAALEKQKGLFRSKLEFASQKLMLDRAVAMKELEAAQQSSRSSKAAFERLQPFVRNGAVTRSELDEVENLYMSGQSMVLAKENLVKQIEFAIKAAKNDVLIVGDRVDDEIGKIETELEIAKAEEKELQQLCDVSAKRASDLEVLAPRDGLVYVNYRQPGEYIRIADELIGLSYNGATWAAGHVTAGQASRVLPGQPVTITVPAMQKRLEGVVMAVGHRAMYSRGYYNAEFRGATATDVPVKVYIEDLPENMPSGIRLGMTINTGFGLKWLDDKMGYELRAIGSKQREKQAKPKSDAKVILASLPESKE